MTTEFQPITVETVHLLRKEFYFSTTLTPQERENIYSIIENAFLNSSKFREMMNYRLSVLHDDGYENAVPYDAVRGDGLVVEGAEGVPGGNFVLFINKSEGSNVLYDKVLHINFEYTQNGSYISKDGRAVEATFASTLLHELGHMLGGYDDWAGQNLGEDLNLLKSFSSRNIEEVNQVYRDLGIPERLLYTGFDAAGEVLVRGQDYAHGVALSNAIIAEDGHELGVDIDLSSLDNPGNVALIGGAEDNQFTGGSGHDRLFGGDGKDIIYGGAGNDFIFTGNGDDEEFYGGNDNDTFFVDGTGSKYFDGGDGIDTIKYENGQTEGVVFDVDSKYPTIVGIPNPFGKTELVVRASTSAGAHEYSQIENIIGTEFADTLRVVRLPAAMSGTIIDLGGTVSQNNVADTVNLESYQFAGWVTTDLRGINQIIFNSSGESVILRGAEGVLGSSGEDRIYASNQGDDIRGGDGADKLYGGSSNDTIYAGREGVDDGAVDEIWSGGGSDQIYYSDQDRLKDRAGSSARLYYVDGTPRPEGLMAMRAAPPVGGSDGAGHLLVGGEDKAPPSNPCNPDPHADGGEEDDGVYEGADGARYILNNGTLRIEYNGGTVFLDSFRNGDGGIRLKEKRPDQDQAECQRDPLIIDLDGDRNVVRELFDSSAYFDLDNDGFRERVAWSLSGDGILVRDRNGNGQIDDGTELFGSGRSEFDGGVATQKGTSGFVELTTLDSNLDGAISALDADFAALRVWIDANGDAVTDEGELKTLAELGIVSISLSTLQSNDLDCGCDGTEITYRSHVTFADGSLRSMYDAYLSIDQYDTREIVNDVQIPADFADLPFLIGSGTLSDLDVAMARDPALEEMVRAFAALTPEPAGEIGQRVEQIILRWTGADVIAPDSRGTAINARWLRAIEKVSGSDFIQASIGANPRADAASILITEWSRLVGDVTAKLLGQTELGQSLLPGLSFAAAAFYVAADGTTVQSVLAQVALNAPGDEGAKLSYWHTVVTSLQRYAAALGVTATDLNAALDQVLLQQGVELTTYELTNALFATGAGGGLVIDASQQAVNSQIYATNRVLVATQGDARLDGGYGDDRYIVTDSVGVVTIADSYGTDSLDLRGWSRSATTATTRLLSFESGSSLGSLTANFELTLTQGASSVKVNVELRNGKLHAAADNIIFDDGQFGIADLVDLGERFVVGVNTPDFDFGSSPADQFLIGQGVSDIYRLTAVSGIDFVVDNAERSSPEDILKIAALPGEVNFSSTGLDLSNLAVSVSGSGSSITIAGQFASFGQNIDYFEFSNGTRLSAAQVQSLLTTGTAGNDILQGTAAQDLFDGMGGSDVLAGGAGDDTYVFHPGYGQLVINDLNGQTHVRIEGSVAEADLDFSIGSEGLLISVGAGEDSILLRGNRYANNATVELNGTTINVASHLLDKARDAGTLINGRIDGTAGNDDLHGSDEADLMVGNGGRDWAWGGLGNDTYLVTSGQVHVRDSGFGFDRILVDSAFSLKDFQFVTAGTYSNTMRIRLGGAELRVDLPNSVNSSTGLAETRDFDVEVIAFADGYIIDLTSGRMLTGGTGNDVLFNYGTTATTFTPGGGDDYIYSLRGNHSLQVEAAFGHDVFYSRTAGDITFSGIALDGQVSFARDGLDLVVKAAGGADTLTLKNAFEPLAVFHDRTLFFSGSQITVQEIVNSIAVGTDGDDILWRQTTLDGGAGNDVLIGDSGTDSYVFGRGYGHDVIKEQDGIWGNTGSSDVLTLVGLNRSDVTFSRDASDPLSVVITIRDTGETLTLDGTPFDSFTYSIEDTFGEIWGREGDQAGAHWIDQIVFADGTSLSQRDIEQAVIDAERTTGADVLENFGAPSGASAETGAVLDGGEGDDSYINRFDDIYVGMSAGTGSDHIVNLNPNGTRVNVALSGLSAIDILILYEVRNGRNVTVLRAKSGEELVIDGHAGTRGLSVTVSDTAAGTYYDVNTAGAMVSGQTPTDGIDYLNGDISDDFYSPIVFDDTFNPGKGNDVVAGMAGADTLIFNVGDGADRLIRFGDRSTGGAGRMAGSDQRSGSLTDMGESYTIELGAGFARQDFTYSWLDDGSYDVRLSFNDAGDSVIVDARVGGSIVFNNGDRLTIRPVGGTVITLWPGDDRINDPSNDAFEAQQGNILISVGAGSGQDRFSDASLSASEGPVLQLPWNWAPSTLNLVGGSSLDDFEFVQDSSAPNNLVVRNLLDGSSIVIEGQFASERALNGQTAWLNPDFNGDGGADWSFMDLNGDGRAEFAGLDSDGDGTPNWTNPDFDGDGQADWQHYTMLSLDTDGDGNGDIFAYDDNSDGVIDSFEIELTPTAAQPNISFISLRDTDGDNIVDAYTNDFVIFTPFPTDAGGAIIWGAIDTNNDGVADITPLDIDGNGSPDWLAADLDGDGQNDWRDQSYDDLYDLSGNYLGSRVLDAQLGETKYLIYGPDAVSIARDTSGDGVPDDVGIDRDGDNEADVLHPYHPIQTFQLHSENLDGSISVIQLDWSAIAGRVIVRDEGAEANSIIDLPATRPGPTPGNDILLAGYAEQIDGLAGDDQIYAIDGGVTVNFGRGSGNDTLFASSGNGVVFTNIQSADEIEVLLGAGDSADLIIRIRDTGEQLRIAGLNTDGWNDAQVVGWFQFADGMIFRLEQMLMLAAGESGSGDGVITTGSGGGLLDGGAGSDTLAGGSGNDIYQFGRGYDEDIIRDAGGADTVNFAQGVALADLHFSRIGQSGGDLLIEATGIERLSLTVAGQFLPGSARVENFQFADGRSFTWSDIEAIILGQVQTSGHDTIVGFSGDDVLRGLAGNDTLTGTWGDDAIDGGTGRDTATYRGAAAEYDIVTVNGVTTVTDHIAGRDGTDTLSNVEEVHFAAGGGSTVLLAGANNVPVAAGMSASGTEDTDIVIARASLLTLTSDADGDTLQFSVKNASHGKVWIGLDGNIRFRADADFYGEAGFDYSVVDGNGGTAIARVTISVASVNDAPVVTTGFADVAVLEDQPILVTIPATLFGDVDGDAVAIAVRRAGGEALPGWLSFADGALSGIPPLDFNGNLDLEITGSDGTLTTAVPFTLSILALNDAPRLVTPMVDQTVPQGGAVSIAIPTSNFVDPEGDLIDVTLTLANGEALPSWLTYTNGVLQGTVPANQVEPIALAIHASDGRAMTTSLFAINVANNAAPVVGTTLPDVILPEDGQIAIALLANAFTDADGDTLALAASLAGGDPLPDWLTFDGGQFTGQPPADFHGTLDLIVTASDGTDTASQGFRLTIEPVNDAPALLQPMNDLVAPEDEPFSVALPIGMFGDADGEALVLSAALTDGSALPSWLTFDAASGTFSGMPGNGDIGSIAIAVRAADPAGASTTGSFVLTITNVNDAPVLSAVVENRSIAEDMAFSLTLPETLFFDADAGDVLTITVTSSDGAALPDWLHYDAATRTLSGTPLNENVGAMGVKVIATDQIGAVASTHFSLTVTNVNDAPVVGLVMTNVTFAEDTAVDFLVPPQTFSDVDGDALTLSAALADGSLLPDWLTFDGSRFSGTPPLNFNGFHTIRLTASDGLATASIDFALSITPVNDAPVVLAPIIDQQAAEDHAIDLALPAGVFGDADGEVLALTATLVGGGILPSWLAFDAATRRFTGQPPADFHGTLEINVTASDGTASVSDSFIFEIASINDAPVLAAALPDVTLSGPNAINLALPSGIFSDVDGDALTLTARLAGGGALPSWLSFDGSRFTGTPPAGYTALDIEVLATDGSLAASDVFRLSVDATSGGNEAPVLLQPLADVSVIRGAALDITVPAGAFGDPDGDALTYMGTLADGSALPSWLSYANGHLTGTVAGGALGDYSIRITANDGSLTTSDVFTLTVGMLPTGPERTPSQQFSEGNDRIVGRGASNLAIWALGGDDYVTADGWNVGLHGEGGNDILEFMNLSETGEGGAGADTFIFDGFSLLGGIETDTWATITDFQNGVDRIGIVNETAGIGSFADLASHLVQNGSNVDIVLQGLPTIVVENIILADLDVSDFMFGNWATSGGFGAAPAAGAIPWPATTVTRSLGDWQNIGNASERIVGDRASNTSVDALDGDDYITSDGWSVSVYGGRGNDVIELFGPQHYAMGGAGYDYFVFDSTMLEADPWEELWATIGDFHDGADKIVFLGGSDGLHSFADLSPFMSQDGDDVKITITGHPAIIVEDIALANLTADDFLFVNQQPVLKALKASSAIRMGNTVGVTTVTADGYSNVTIAGTTNGDVLDFTNVTLTNIVRVTGGDGNDHITGNTAANVIWGGNGNDTIFGGAGNDTLLGDAGDDILSGGAGTDIINGGAANDTVDYSYATANLTVSLATTSAQTVATGDVDTITNVENMIGGAGNDTLTGTSSANVLAGGAGNDMLNGGAGADTLSGDADNDRIAGGIGNDTIDGGAGTDVAVFAGVSTTYSISTIGGNIRMIDNATSQDGNDGTDTLIGVETAEFKNGVQVGLAAPIILDFDGGGVTTVSASDSRARYDMDGDGRADDTSWMGSGEGMLFLDRDGNGTLSNAGEFTFVNDLPGAASDLTGLRAYDSNSDGILSADDSRFAQFHIWRDRSGDGVVDDGEITTLADMDVLSINLAGSAVEGTFALGDTVIVNKGSYTRNDGTTAGFVDAALTYFSAKSPTSTLANFRQPSVAASLAGLKGRFQAEVLAEKVGGTVAGVLDPFQAADQLVSALRMGMDADDPIRHPAWQNRNLAQILAGRPAFAAPMWGTNGTAGPDVEPLVPAQPNIANVDRLLASMIQGMVTFGVESGGDNLAHWKNEASKPVDFFA